MKSHQVSHSFSSGKYFGNLDRSLKDKSVNDEHLKWMSENSERIEATVAWFEKFYKQDMRIAEIGPGGVGIAIKESFPGVELDAFDCVEWFKPLYDQYSINWSEIDLNSKMAQSSNSEKYDAIFLCEVIEHLARWPVEVFEDLKSMLKPGGVILVTTQNLHRASNRVRMITGKRLFADFTPESLVMGHIREYTPEEMGALLEYAGFNNVEGYFTCFPDLKSSHLVRGAYSMVCNMFPKLANHFFVWGQK